MDGGGSGDSGTGVYVGQAGAFARLTFDLVPFEDGSQRAVYLLARGSVDSVGPLAVLSIIPLLQGGVGLGLRF